MASKQSIKSLKSILFGVKSVHSDIKNSQISPSEAVQILHELKSLEGTLAEVVFKGEELAAGAGDAHPKLYNAIDCDNGDQVFASELCFTPEAAEIGLGLEAVYRNVGSYKIIEMEEGEAIGMPNLPDQSADLSDDFTDINASLAHLGLTAMAK